MREIRAVYFTLGSGMWWSKYVEAGNRLCVDDGVLHRLTGAMSGTGMNMAVIDLGEAIRWPSHPEIACAGAWSVEKLRAELDRMRKLGLEPIPKMNLSTTHNMWLGAYRRMCSSPDYMKICDEIIADAIELFDRPRFVHIGFDEETAAAQPAYDVSIVRSTERWYRDLLAHVKSCEKRGARAWMWSDRGWRDPAFVMRCPKSVVQSNWYYDEDLQGFDVAQANDDFSSRLALFGKLDAAGFDQIPCGSNWRSAIQKASGVKVNRSIREVIALARTCVSPGHLKGFMMAPWTLTDEKGEAELLESVDVFSEGLM